MKPYKICIAIPIKSVSTYEKKELLSEVINHNPDYIELRFDYLDETTTLNSKFIKFLLELSNIPIICTFRKHSEGGHCKISDEKRLSILKKIINTKPEFLDIEMDNSLKFFEEILPLTIPNQIALIFSHHNFKETPNNKEMENIIYDFKSRLKKIDLFTDEIFNNCIWKLIFTAERFEDNLKVLKFCKSMVFQNKRVITFCMGKLGIFSRLLSVKLGGFLTFGSFMEKTAPGQININKMREIYSLLEE